MNISNINNEYFNKYKFNLRKIAVGLTLATSIILSTGCGSKIDQIEKISEKYESVNDLDENEMLIIGSLAAYEDAFKMYQENQNNVDARVKLVTETKKLSNVANKLIEVKINEALGTNYDIKVKCIDGGSDYVITGDNELLDCKVPKAIIKIMSDKDFIDSDIYKGTGESQAWDKDIDKFVDKGFKLYKSILENVQEDYKLDNQNLVTKNDIEEHKMK